MRIRLITMLSAILVGAGLTSFAQNVEIIPKPLHVRSSSGSFSINRNTVIYVDAQSSDFEKVAQQLADEIFSIKGFKPNVIATSKPGKGNFILIKEDTKADTLGSEGYGLTIESKTININASKAHGAFYGVQSLVQLIRNSSDKIPAMEIYDKPRFAWRGMMLDVGRYFYSIEFVKKLIDNLAVYKINSFHWHLTEDQGWRIEIKKYPELTSKSAWRAETRFAVGLDKNWIQQSPHGGFYTQEEIKEVVAYAKSKFITVIPEVELPGHSVAVLSAFPNLSCTGGPFEVTGHFGVFKDIYCAGNEDTFKFIEDVLSEVVELFPGEVFHIGGDEAPKDRWKVCAKCQARIKENNLKDEYELQAYFIKRVQAFLKTKNKKIIGWDEILEGSLAPNAMVMSWRGTKGGIAAAKMKHDVVMSPGTHLYFDYYQGEADLEPPHGRIRALPLPVQRVYEYEPVPTELTIDEAKHIKGLQANVWTEVLHSREGVEHMIFPRITAVAEIGWTDAKQKNFENFTKRLENEWPHFEKRDINAAKTLNNAWVTSRIDSTTNTAMVEMKSYRYNTEVRYTLDGTYPTANSALYRAPVLVKLPLSIHAAVYRDGKRLGKVTRRSVAIIEKVK